MPNVELTIKTTPPVYRAVDAEIDREMLPGLSFTNLKGMAELQPAAAYRLIVMLIDFYTVPLEPNADLPSSWHAGARNTVCSIVAGILDKPADYTRQVDAHVRFVTPHGSLIAEYHLAGTAAF